MKYVSYCGSLLKCLKATSLSHLIFPQNSEGWSLGLQKKNDSLHRSCSSLYSLLVGRSQECQKGRVWLAGALKLMNKGHVQGGKPWLLDHQDKL